MLVTGGLAYAIVFLVIFAIVWLYVSIEEAQTPVWGFVSLVYSPWLHGEVAN